MTTVELNCHISSSNITHLILCLYQMCLGCSYTMRTGIQLYEQVNRRATHTHRNTHAKLSVVTRKAIVRNLIKRQCVATVR